MVQSYFLLLRLPPASTLFPYTTLFRSLQNLQNYTQSSTGFTLSSSYALHHSFKRLGITYSLDRSSIVAVSTASQNLFNRSEEHTSELQSRQYLVCRLLLEKKKSTVIAQ